MPIHDIYSKREQRARQAEPEVWQYDWIPEQLRMQIRYIFGDAIGPHLRNARVWRRIRDIICRERGVPFLRAGGANAMDDCISEIMFADNVDHWLDVVEMGARWILSMRDLLRRERESLGITQKADDAIEELNGRFREAGLGYQFEDGKFIRCDSYLVHSEVVKPALVLLSDPRFAGAQDEFLSAHAHYRAGEHEDAIVDANRAFESTMKTICDIKDWDVPKGARASDLFRVIRANGLLPDYLGSSFDQLIGTLKSGLPAVRNEAGGHGQGATPRKTPGYVAGYALHLAAVNILFLAEALRASE